MSIQIQIRRGIAADWTSANPILAYGEMGLETDTYQFKWGDGVTAWTALAYFGTGFGTGTVTSVDVTTANGVSATGGPITTSGSFTFSLGAITPTSVNGITLSGSGSIANSGVSSLTAFTGSGTSSGTNTGNQTITLTGDVTGSGTGSFAATIANDAVTFAKFQNITATRLLGRFSGVAGDMEEITLGTGLSFTLGTLNVSGFASSTLANNHIFVGNASNVATDVAMSGDATIVASGALTLASVISAGGPTGSATVAPIITWDAKGRLTAVSSATITPAASSITGGAALTRVDDTNVTLTLGGTPTTALLAATSITAGWAGTLSGARGGTGVANTGFTITLAGNLVTSGAFSITLTSTATTNVTLPTTGTLATLAGTETLTNKKLVDNSVTFVDNGDATKQLAFECSGITTATTRTVTAVNWSGTDVLSNGALTSGRVPFSGATGLQDDADLTFATDTLTCKIYAVTTRIEPVANDGAPLGSTTKQFSDLFLAEGGVINWDNGDATLTQVGDVVTLAGADLKVTTPGNVSTSVLTTDGTQTVTNKTIAVTQLNGSANTVAVNNTGATANYTETTYKDVAKAAYTDTIAWTGTTAPSGATNHEFWWKQVGNLVTLTISLSYATAGSALSLVDMILPAAIPVPVAISGTTTNDKVASGTGWIDSASNGTPPACRVWMIKNASTYSIRVAVASNNSKVAFATITYSTN